MKTLTVVLVATVLLAHSPATALSRSTQRAKLSPGARMALHFWQADRPLPRPGRAPVFAPTYAHVTLAFATAPTAERLHDIAASGVEFYAGSRGPLRIGRLVPARVPFSLLDALAEAPDIVRVELQLDPPRPELVENVPELVEIPPTHLSLDSAGIPITGKGVTVGVLDSWVDHYHPWFFRPDGESFGWVDVNDNGVFDPGVDGLDSDGNGTVDTTEVLRLQKGSVSWNEGMGELQENTTPDYLLDLDWLYQDLNGNGQRDAGASLGYKETTPAYGEPLFVADDVNRDGQLGRYEKLVQLRTSKLSAVLLVGKGEVYSRGDNLIHYPRLLQDSSHATMTLGVLAGGAPPYQSFHGTAPDVDILLSDMNQGGGFWGEDGYGDAYLAASIALAEAGAQVLMHEYGSPLMEYGDGTSLLEQGIDQLATEQGILSCTAAHNYAGYQMHAVAPLPAGDSVVFPIATNVYDDYFPTAGLYLTLRHRHPEVPIALKLSGPGGFEFDVPLEEAQTETGGMVVWSTGLGVSERGTAGLTAILFPEDWEQSLPGKQWALEVTNLGEADVELDLFAADQTGYLYSANLEEYTTKAGTMAHPSTADSTLTVGAYRGNVDSWYGEIEVGDLTYYSGQGPRIDGARGVDIVGPSDMLAAWYDPNFPFYPGLSYASGTSGSLPQATAVAALLLQAEPELTAAEVKNRIEAGAILDGFTGPEASPTWGAGKLSAWRTVFGTAPPAHEPPTAIANGPAEVYLSQPFVLDATDSVGDGPLQVRWDIGYNGSYDIPYRDDLTLPVDAIYEPGAFLVLAQVRDVHGWTDRTLVHIHVIDEPYVPPVEPAPDVVSELDVTGDAWAEDGLNGDALETTDTVTGETPGKNSGCQMGTADTSPSLALLTLLLLALVACRCICRHTVRQSG